MAENMRKRSGKPLLPVPRIRNDKALNNQGFVV
jgi:hypothetical protein